MPTVTGRQTSRLRRSRASTRAARGAIALAALGLAIAVVRFGAASSLEHGDPVRASAFAPGNARAAVASARARINAGTDAASPAVRARVAAALRRDVTVPGAIELRAAQLHSAGDTARAARLFALSSAISRRSLPTRLWLIQRSVDRGDVAGALANFDLALRTSTAAPPILFPVLAGAASDPGLVEPIARLLDRPSEWRGTFLSYASGEVDAAVPLAAVVLRMRDRAAVTAGEADRVLIGHLVKQGEFATAKRIEERFGRGVPRGVLLIDPDFSRPEALYPFGWGLLDSAETGAARSRVGGRSALAFRAVAGAGGQVATQLLVLEPGAYRLATANAAAPADPSVLPFWTVTCAGNGGGRLALLRQPAALRDPAVADFNVPGGCGAQWLAFHVLASDRHDGQSGAIRSVSVQRR